MSKEEYYNIIVDSWNYFKKYFGQMGHVDFEKLVKEGIDLSNQYNSKFANDIIIAVQEEIDRQDRKAHEHE